MAAPEILFDAVLFDLDGTLVATDRFWVDAARAGARRAFDELGIERELPSAEDWMSVVGLPLARGFDTLFEDLPPAARRVVLARCVEEEERAVRAGGARLLAGAEEALESLRAAGLRLGLASNCGHDYLAAMLTGLGLERWIEEARCLDSAGVGDKAGMIEDVLERFDTRSALFVGDRIGDRDAAWANALPHVHHTAGFARASETVVCEAEIAELAELVPLLERRARWLDSVLERAAGAFAPGERRARVLGVGGGPGAGKTLFARDLARRLAARGEKAVVLALDEVARGPAPQEGCGVGGAERSLERVREAFDLPGLLLRARQAAAQGAFVLVEGLYLLAPELREALGFLVHLEVGEEVLLRRAAGRERLHGAERVLRLRKEGLPFQRAFEERFPPGEIADLVLAADSPLGPA